MRYSLLFIILLLVPFKFLLAQSTSSDDLFKQARKAAFDQKSYPQAIILCKEALHKNPDFADVRIFLGNLYVWSKEADSARVELNQVLIKYPDNEDASIASANLEYWNDRPVKALEVIAQGLKYHPGSKGLLLLKAKVLNDLKRFNEADGIIDTLLKVSPNNTEVRSLAVRVKDKVSKNRVSASYDFIYFDKQFNDPWHLISIDYSRQTSLGSIAARVNYANRFNTNGIQFEVDAYPHISKMFYSYVSGGYSPNLGVFPKYRGGFSLYANLPASLEAEAGLRFLSFGDPTWIYTASASKYYKSYWFNVRTYLTPSNNNISGSFSLNTRYYYAGTDDYLSFGIGTGISPDDPRNNVLFNNGSIYKLRANSLSTGYKHAFKTLNVLSINLSLVNQEYQQQKWGNQFDVGISYLRRF